MENSERSLIERLMDNPWLLLAVGFGLPFVSYTLWGWVETLTLPVAKLP